jgi:hypothetical protein
LALVMSNPPKVFSMRPFHSHEHKLLRSVVTPWRSAYTLNIPISSSAINGKRG